MLLRVKYWVLYTLVFSPFAVGCSRISEQPEQYFISFCQNINEANITNQSVLSVAIVLCQLMPKNILSIPECSVWVNEPIILLYLEISYKEINLLPKHPVSETKIVCYLTNRFDFILFNWLIFFCL